MSQPYPYTEIDMLRSFSLVFSRSVFKDIIEYNDFTRLNAIVEQYDIDTSSYVTYGDVIRKIYRAIRKKYCCEYNLKTVTYLIQQLDCDLKKLSALGIEENTIKMALESFSLRTKLKYLFKSGLKLSMFPL